MISDRVFFNKVKGKKPGIPAGRHFSSSPGRLPAAHIL